MFWFFFFVLFFLSHLFFDNVFLTERLQEDDSDMLMEPDEFRATALIPTHATGNFFQSNEFRSNEFRPLVPEYVHLERPLQQRIRSIEDTRALPPQNLFPSSFFRNVPPLGHSRPYFSSQESHGNRFNAGRSYDQSILGSGDFGVLRGGTFYQEDDPPARQSFESGSDEYLGYFNSNNGHGRPANTPPFIPKTFFPDEQFANFRDFADINTPTDPAYSQYVVVYANKNSTEPHPNPKNIFEQLQLLDKENVDDEREQKKNSISKFKKKLAKTKLEKRYNKKIGAKENNAGDIEPLLALS